MTDFQMSLAGIGAIVLAGVLIYNKWQEYRAKKTVEKAFARDHEDVLMQPDAVKVAPGPRTAPAPAFEDTRARVEPTFQGEAAPQFTPVSEPSFDEAALAGLDVAPADDGAPATAPAPAPIPAASAPAAPVVPAAALDDGVVAGLIDPVIDCQIPLALDGSVSGQAVLQALNKLERIGDKLVQLVGQRQDGEWEAIESGAHYTRLLVGVQMASRASALNELEFSELVTRVRGIADELGAEPEVPDMIDVMANARALHRFVLDHDAQLGVNVQSTGAPWAINSLLVSLEKQGFDLRADGSFVMPDGDGAFLYAISTNAPLSSATTPRLTLLLDAPRVLPARDAFSAMTSCAKSLATRLGGVVVDDGNAPLADATLSEIRQQLTEFYNEMHDAEIAAGSVRALRLFS